MNEPLRVLIVDDHAAARFGLRLRLGREPDLAVVGDAADMAGAVRLAPQLRPDVVLVDLLLSDGDGIDLVSRLRQVAPRSACLILSLHDSAHNRRRAAAAGIAEFVGKQEPTQVLLTAIRRAGLSVES
jgi:two-component system, NarL family, nitrate/nitrite response regulator NarL